VAGSLIYVGTHAITRGKLDLAKQVSREMGAFLEAQPTHAALWDLHR
jgi:hypothetical protein